MNKYSDEVIAKAKNLYEIEGFSAEKIAALLELSRRQTVQEWKIKYGWNRKVLPSVTGKGVVAIEYWEKVRKKSLKYMDNEHPKSMSEANKMFQIATFNILKAQSMMENEEESEDKGDKVLSLLNSFTAESDDN